MKKARLIKLKWLVVMLISAFFLLPVQATAKREVVNFAINSPGSQPYLYFDRASNTYVGVVADFFNSFAAQEQLKVSYLDSSRGRSEGLLRQGKADVFLSGVVWLDAPDEVIVSDTLMPHDSYIYATQAFQKTFKPEDHPFASVCTRYGFIYPVLQPFFEQPEGLVRVNSASQVTMGMMLAKGRCDYAIMSEQNAQSILTRQQFCDTAFYQSPNVISKVDLVLVIRKERTALRTLISRYLAAFKASGQLDASIKKHSGEQRFPKLRCDSNAS